MRRDCADVAYRAGSAGAGWSGVAASAGCGWCPVSADVLREAAGLMRSRATDCADGWDMAHTPESWFEMYHVDRDFDQDAPHIAGWHPLVALAVADWLEQVASWELIDALVCDDWRMEYAVARDISSLLRGGDL